MYADGGLLFPYLQGGLDFYREAQQCQFQLQEEELLWRLQNSIFIDSSSSSSCNSLGSSTSSYEQGGHLPVVSAPTSGSTLIQASRVSEYDLGGEGDLFKAPEPILELPELAFDPMATAISMISGGEDITAGEVARVTAAEFDAMESSDPLLSEVFYECRKDLLANSAIEEPLEALGIEILELQGPGPEGVEEQQDLVQRDNRVGAATEGPLQKSVSSGCLLSSNDWGHGGGMPRPSFLGFQDVDLGAAFGLRRAYSEGDIKTLEAGNISHVSTREILRSEERQQKLSRYRKKKEKRNFGRKIKYACRKALADSQPRVRGRFARTECESAKHQ